MKPDWKDPRMARAAWSRIAEPGDRAAGVLVQAIGPGEALTWLVDGAHKAGLARLEPLEPGAVPGQGGFFEDRAAQVRQDRGLAAAVKRWRPRLENLDPRRELRVLEDLGGVLLIPEEEGWPVGLDDLGADAPLCLWGIGSVMRDATVSTALARSAAVVGSRASTRYGEIVTHEIVSCLVERGVAIVSGGAFGIDAAAHRAALGASGVTVAVMAGGVDRPYPAGNALLLGKVADSGALIAEVPPFSAPRRERFLQRNRLIAAITQATVIVEAGWRSGAQSTARHGATLLRPVGAVPGPVTSPASAGCHRLIRENVATCVTDGPEVLELLDGCDAALADALEHGEQAGPLDDLPSTQRQVLDCLPLRGTAQVDALAAAAALPGRDVLAALGALERTGLAERADFGWRKARPGTASGAARGA
ncbi:MAG: DNA-protecting protein DprA [Micrococcales bacterium]|nr:DNA-protecting protein DprA [Micrococcales bacterium]